MLTLASIRPFPHNKQFIKKEAHMFEGLRTKTTASLLVAGAIGGTLLAGCSSAPKAKWSCMPEGNASAVPSELRADYIAQQLGHGITAAQVKAGELGDAHCDTHTITAHDINYPNDNSRVAITGVAPLCLAIGLNPPDGLPPKDGVRYHDIQVVCPASAS